MSVDVTVYDGKYRYIFDEKGARALRHGEPWRDCCGDGLVLALAQDLQEAREHLEVWRHGMTLVEGWAISDAEGNQGDAKEWLRLLRDWINQHGSDEVPKG